jgi:Tfp pilus assembly protein PilV
MAGIQLNKRVAASTLLEVVISMVIILVVFGIAMMIFTNVMRFSTPAKQVRAAAILHDELAKAEGAKAFNTQTLSVAGFRVEETVSQYNEAPGLLLVQLTAFDQNQQQVAELQKIEIAENEKQKS